MHYGLYINNCGKDTEKVQGERTCIDRDSSHIFQWSDQELTLAAEFYILLRELWSEKLCVYKIKKSKNQLWDVAFAFTNGGIFYAETVWLNLLKQKNLSFFFLSIQLCGLRSSDNLAVLVIKLN